VLTQLLHKVLLYTIQHTTFLLSCELLRRLLRSVLTPPFDSLHWPLKLHTSPWVQPLGPIHYPFSCQLTGLVLLWSQHHLLLSICSGYPCGPVSRRSFHNIQRHCYLHRSYQWRDSRESEQACLNEPLLAELCRHTSFGCVTTVILH
jgi:hypothetical protein